MIMDLRDRIRVDCSPRRKDHCYWMTQSLSVSGTVSVGWLVCRRPLAIVFGNTRVLHPGVGKQGRRV